MIKVANQSLCWVYLPLLHDRFAPMAAQRSRSMTERMAGGVTVLWRPTRGCPHTLDLELLGLEHCLTHAAETRSHNKGQGRTG